MIQREPLIILTGPTAVGKTKLSIELAKKINGAIISADSMQVYQYMDIGSAKITKEEMEGVPHYLVDQFMPEEEFHVVRFQAEAKNAITKIRMKGQIPIVVGGTGFYIQALLNDIDFSKDAQAYTFNPHCKGRKNPTNVGFLSRRIFLHRNAGRRQTFLKPRSAKTPCTRKQIIN